MDGRFLIFALMDERTDTRTTKKPPEGRFFCLIVAERTGLEPATSGVTGQHSNRLNYRSTFGFQATYNAFRPWRPHGDSNPGRHRERVMS